jgi:hypothetical protein
VKQIDAVICEESAENPEIHCKLEVRHRRKPTQVLRVDATNFAISKMELVDAAASKRGLFVLVDAEVRE